MRNAIRLELALIGAILVVGLVAGLVTGHYFASFFVLTLLYLFRHVYQLFHLLRLVSKQQRVSGPYPLGVWGEIYFAISQYQQRIRKRKKRQVRVATRFREAALSVPEALVITDKNRRVEWANPAASSLFNIHWPSDEGRSLTEIFRYPELDDIIETGDNTRSLEFFPAHNRAIMVTVRITPFGEKKRQRLLVGRDITKIHHINTIRRDFVTNASHELRTPLTVIMGFLENLVDAPSTPQTHHRPLALMQSQALRMQNIIEDLLILSRLEMAQRPEMVGPVDVPTTMLHILHQAESLSAGQHNISSEINQDLLLTANEEELHSAFSNLVTNAVKHTPEGTRIFISWSESPLGPCLAVEDTGSGISAEHIPRLTERFYRVDDARSRASGGTGLGLAIVKHVLIRHEAEMHISSTVNEGTTFTCRFPRKMALQREQLHDFSRVIPNPLTKAAAN